MRKEKPHGIYKITSPSGRIYIGQGVNIYRRMSSYKHTNAKRQPKLGNSFKKYGIDNHTFEILEECSIEELNCRERYWQEFYNSVEIGLNCVYVECGEKRGTGVKRFGKDAPNYGNKWSDEQRKRASDRRKGTKASEETKQLFSEMRKGGGNVKAKLVLDLNTGIYYDCLKDACIVRGLNYHTAKNQVNGTYTNKTNIIYV